MRNIFAERAFTLPMKASVLDHTPGRDEALLQLMLEMNIFSGNLDFANAAEQRNL